MFDSGYFSFCDYMEQIGVDLNCPLWSVYRDTSQCGPIWMLDMFCVVSGRPTRIAFQDGVLHCDGAPAVEYPDFSVWALNGTRVSQEIAETPAGKLDPHIILSESNAQVRREAVRKIGIERVLDALDAQVVDSATYTIENNWVQNLFGVPAKEYPYELVLLDLQDGRRRPYLKMLNPSIGTWHVEGVHPDCTTVAEAIKWRNWGLEGFPEQLA